MSQTMKEFDRLNSRTEGFQFYATLTKCSHTHLKMSCINSVVSFALGQAKFKDVKSHIEAFKSMLYLLEVAGDDKILVERPL